MTGDSSSWDRIVQELKTMPPVDSAAPERIVSEIRRLERRTWGAHARGWLLRRRRVTIRPLPTMVGAAAAVAVLALLLRGAGPSGDATGTAAAPPAAGLYPTQFVVVAREASQVAVVGDFNGWDPRAHPLEEISPGVWSRDVPLAPGRHTYAYVVDGERWMPDSLAARAPEDEFGGRSSVLLVAGGF